MIQGKGASDTQVRLASKQEWRILWHKSAKPCDVPCVTEAAEVDLEAWNGSRLQ